MTTRQTKTQKLVMYKHHLAQIKKETTNIVSFVEEYTNFFPKEPRALKEMICFRILRQIVYSKSNLMVVMECKVSIDVEKASFMHL